MNLGIGTRIIDIANSPINGEIKVVKSLAFGTYIQVGGITQSGGMVENIWRQTLRKISHQPLAINNCLVLGLGGGSAAKLVQRYWPEAKIIGVDIDTAIVELGKKYLGLDKKKIQIKIQDAFDFCTNAQSLMPNAYDLIIVDLYLGREYPEKFESDKFLRLMLRLLSEGGVAVFNRLYYGEKRPEAMKFGKKLENIFSKVEYFYPEANIMFFVKKRPSKVINSTSRAKKKVSFINLIPKLAQLP